MKSSRRLQRMDRRAIKVPKVVLTSLMDIFIVIVIYLLMNQAIGLDIAPPKTVILPESIVDAPPRQTVLMTVSNTDVIVQGALIATVAEILESDQDDIPAIRSRMLRIKESYIGLDEASLATSTEVTIMADRGVPFKVLKRLMTTSSNAGYVKISLAVNKKQKQK